MKIANKYNLKVIEDCAEAHGAMYNNKKVGSFGDIGCFSFYGNKIITTGEGGMCTTNSSSLDEKMRILRDHGMNKTKRYWHDIIGYNYRLTNLQASIGLAQVERIESIHKNRKKYEVLYKEKLGDYNFQFQYDYDNRKRVVWLVSAIADTNLNREKYISIFKKYGIDARPFFYRLSDMGIYKSYCKVDTPIAKNVSERGISFPTYESLESSQKILNCLEYINNEL